MSTRSSDVESEFSLPYSIKSLGATPSTDGAAEAWITACTHGYVFDAWCDGYPIFLGSNCASVAPEGLLQVYERFAISLILEATSIITRRERVGRWRALRRRFSDCVWEGRLGQLFAAWCEVVREVKTDSSLGETLHYLAPQTSEARLAFPVVIFVTMLREAIAHGHAKLHAKETTPIPQWRVEVGRKAR